jgi:chemotaxis family two-component system response regulator Rcp1
MIVLDDENDKSFIVLLVEDNPGDVRLTQEAFKESKLLHKLYVVRDGEEALDFLFRKGNFSVAPTPDLILLDLNLPKKSGREVLVEIKNDPNLKFIPVVVLTTSEADEDILNSYKLHANCYITKPVEFDKFLNIIKRIEDFWLSIVKLPKKRGDD